MESFNALFYKRIGLSGHETVSFEHLDSILEHMSKAIPFENLRILNRTTMDITKENLVQKIAIHHEGGLCYELNPMLYYFLIENGFDAELLRGTVYNHTDQRFSNAMGTHATILLTHEGHKYILDTGFGGNLPLKPVPFSGEAVVSSNGEFRIIPIDSEYGNFALEMKLKHKDTSWRVGYAFDTRVPVQDITKEMNEILDIVSESPDSSFNKNSLMTKLTERGSITLTDTSFTTHEDGHTTKEEIDQAQYEALKKRHFGM